MTHVNQIVAFLRVRANQQLSKALRIDSDSLTKVQATSEHTALVTAADAIASQFRGELDQSLPRMSAAFRTTESGPDGYVMRFKFGSLEELHAADDDWRAILAGAALSELAPVDAVQRRGK